MRQTSNNTAPKSVVPMMRYRDLAASLDWLCNAFGFQRDCVVCGDDGSAIYAQLVLGGGMVMLGPVGESDFDRLMRQPAEIGGAETQSCYLVVGDISAHYARARAAGAEILIDLTDDNTGGRGYSCRDPGGHIWNFGTYDPWGQRHAQHDSGDQRAPSSLSRVARFSAGMMVGGGLLALAVVAWSAYDPTGFGFRKLNAHDLASAPHGPNAIGPQEVVWNPGEDDVRNRATSDPEKEARLQESERKVRAQEQAARKMRTALSRERIAKHTARQAARKARQQFALERDARLLAERMAQELREQLARERHAAELQRDKEKAKEKEELAAAAATAPQTREDPPAESPSQATVQADPANAPVDEKSKTAKAEPSDNDTAGAERQAAKSVDDKQASIEPVGQEISNEKAKKPAQEPSRKPVEKKDTTRQKKRKTTAQAPPRKRPPKRTVPKSWPYSAWE